MPPKTTLSMKKYLRDYNKATKCGFCIKCDARVPWAITSLKTHKRIKCADFEFQEELRLIQEEEEEELRLKYTGGK